MASNTASSSLLDIFSLSPELLTLILSSLPAKSVLNVSETCRHLRDVVFGCDVLWKRLCMNHFDFDLQVKGPFQSFASLYQLIYKYKVIVENHVFGWYVSEYHCHWSVLLEEGTRTSISLDNPTGYFLCTESRLQKTWDITKNDMTDNDSQKSGNYVTIIDIIKSKLAAVDRKQFQQAVLQRCIRNQKKICKHFVSAAIMGRCDDFVLYIIKHQDAKAILMTKTPIPDYLDDFDVNKLYDSDIERMPADIVMDFLKGHFHKTGIKQVKNYVEFVNTAKCCYKWDIKHAPEKIIDAICNDVYEKHKQTAKLRLISTLEYCQSAEECFARVKEIEKWQDDIEQDLEVTYRSGNFSGISENEAYKNYVLQGKEDDFTSLKNHFEGLINIKIWLFHNMWIKEVLGSSIVSVLKGDPISSLVLAIRQYREIADSLKVYLKTGKKKHFRKLIEKLWLYATRKLERKAEHLYKLQGDLKAKKVSPPYKRS